MKPLPVRKSLRIKGYDYSQTGAYFVTICAYKRRNLFSKVCVGQGLAPAENLLTPLGELAEVQISMLEKRFPGVFIDKYVIMPNHIHMIVCLPGAAGASPCPTLSQVVGAYKSLVTRLGRGNMNPVFQVSYYDHVIRNDTDYQMIWNYIENNPAKWVEDRFYPDDMLECDL